jgi:hypothetical protein
MADMRQHNRIQVFSSYASVMLSARNMSSVLSRRAGCAHIDLREETQ